MKYETKLNDYVPSNASFNALNASQQIADLTAAVRELQEANRVMHNMLVDILHNVSPVPDERPSKKAVAPESKL